MQGYHYRLPPCFQYDSLNITEMSNRNFVLYGKMLVKEGPKMRVIDWDYVVAMILILVFEVVCFLWLFAVG
jgi:hypothetical protein